MGMFTDTEILYYIFDTLGWITMERKMTLGWIWLLACGEIETSDTASNNDTEIEPEETATEVLEDSATETELDTESDQPV